MRCDTAVERILEADREVLEGSAGSPLAGHLRECGDCAALARAVLEGEARLAGALGSIAPGRPVEEALDEARGVVPVDSRRGSRRPARRRRWVAVPLAAAAVAAALLLFPPSTDRGPAVIDVGGRPSLSHLPREPLAVRPRTAPAVGPIRPGAPAAPAATSFRSMSVMQSPDPNVTIVWLH